MLKGALLASCIITSLVHAQGDTSARIRGRASSSFNGRPLSGVMIAVPAVEKFVVSDSTGVFWLDSLPTGVQAVTVSYDGHESQLFYFKFRSGRIMRLSVLVDVDAVDLNPVVVESKSINTWRDLAGFYARKREYGGFARFFTREEIEHIRPSHISDLLLQEGITTRCFSWCLPTRFTRGHLCAIPINVDGLPFREDDYDHIAVSQVAAVEIYRGEPPIGLSFAMGATPSASVWMGATSSTGPGACGLVMIWTRSAG